MNNLKYFIQFLAISFLFIIYKLIGLKYSTIISSKILQIFGPLFRSNDICHKNLSLVFPELSKLEREEIIKKMWSNYGQILAEYMFMRDFRNSKILSDNIVIENIEQLYVIKKSSKPVIFISGHFNNFELMAMCIEKSGINLAAIYRPLNNWFLNPLMENIRRKYICKNQIKKGLSGTKEILKHFKSGDSIALMIDQRVSQGIPSNLFSQKALTTTIPAQFVKKYAANVVPIYIERSNGNNFKIKVYKMIEFTENETIDSITQNLNHILEKMIAKNPSQWIWTHNRWK